MNARPDLHRSLKRFGIIGLTSLVVLGCADEVTNPVAEYPTFGQAATGSTHETSTLVARALALATRDVTAV